MQQASVGEESLGYTQTGANAIDAAVTLDSLISGGIPVGCALIIITPQAQAIRWRDDGTAPTTAVGYPLAAGAELRYTGRNMKAIRVIGQVAAAVLNIVCYAQGK